MTDTTQDWLTLSRKLDWTFTYVNEASVYPEIMSGFSANPIEAEMHWEESYKKSFAECIRGQYEKELSVRAVRDAIGRVDDFASLPPLWMSVLKLNFATLPLAAFNSIIGSLREARFARNSPWRQTSALFALDGFRHTQIPFLISHELVKWDPQFEWTWKFYHSQNWFSLAVRHMLDELLLTTSAAEYAIGVHFIYENTFTTRQFMELSSIAKRVGDKLFEKMTQSIQSDVVRHTQTGQNVIELMVKEDPAHIQKIIDKWFWRSWCLFALTMGFTMDYLTPIEKRTRSFKEFIDELIIPPFLESLERLGLEKPWYWSIFLKSIETYHHMLYATVYTYRSTMWFDLCSPGQKERDWLHRKYPKSWPSFEGIWENIDEKWRQNKSNEFDVHATTLPGLCNTCQMPLCGGTPENNSAATYQYQKANFIFCSEPCQRIFEMEPEKYSKYKGLVTKIVEGEAPANLFSLLDYFGLNHLTFGKDLHKGEYKWPH